MRLTFQQGRFFARHPRFPSNARGVHRRRLWWILPPILIVAAVIFGWYAGQRKPTTQPASPPTAQKAPAQK